MKKVYNLLSKWVPVFILSSLLGSVTNVYAQSKEEKEGFEEHESEFKKLIEEHERELHNKGGNKEQAQRIANYQSALRKTQNSTGQRITSTETLAGGNLIGQWIEKGSNNLAGRIRYADYYEATSAVYVVSDGGNVWKGNLNGTSWTCLNNQLKFAGADYIKVIPNGTGARIIVGTIDKYVYYSDNDGATWNTSTGLSNIVTWGWNLKTVIAADAARTVYLLAIEWTTGATISVYRSTDKATSFTKMKSWAIDYEAAEQNKFSITTPANTTHTAAYVINKDSVCSISSTGTTTTNLFKHNLPVTPTLGFACQKTGSTINMYLATNATVYATTNLGQTWTTLNAPTGNTPWAVNSFNVSLGNANTLYFGDIEAYKGVRSGNTITWTQINAWGDYYAAPASKLHADIPAFVPVLVSAAEQLLVCTDGGLYKSTDGLATVSNLTLTGMNNSQYYSVYTNKNNTNYVYAGSQDQGIQQATTDGGGLLSFTQLVGGDDGRSVSTDNNSVWHTGYDRIYYFPTATSNTAAYTSLNGIGRLWMPYITEHPTNGTIMYMGGGLNGTTTTAKILQFNYNGTSVQQGTSLSYDFAAPSGCTNITGINISKKNNSYWYVLTDNGRFFSSSNGGANFTMNASFVGPAGHYFYGSAIISSTKTLGTLYIAGDGTSGPGVYKSVDHGANFTAITSGLPSTMVFDLAFNADESLVFAATKLGAYVYVVSSNTWYPMIGSAGVDQIYWDVEFVPSTNSARFATYGRGIWDFKAQSLTPVVSITAPANNAKYYVGTGAKATVAITATASETGGTISKVEFYNGATLLGTKTTSPYTYSWTNVSVGTYSITAKAYDGQATPATATSAAVSVSVIQLTPTVSISAPANNATYTAPASITITAAAAETGGTISKVEFYNGATLLGTKTTSPYTYSWTNVAAGTYSITAKAYDGQATPVTATSSPVSVTVNTLAPVVSITAPANNAKYYVGTGAKATVAITATASETGGTISKVEFYNGATLLGTKTTSPYTYSWTNVSVGTYSITAKAYDGQATPVTTTSAAVSVSVIQLTPTVSITAPANNATYTAPASIAITAAAAETGGTISKVEFYNGAALIGTKTTSPYTYTWSGVAAGTYSLTAKAYDGQATPVTATSSAISVTVNAGSTCTAPVWNAGTTYATAGLYVQYNTIKYVSNFWTQGSQPDLNNGAAGSGKPWTSQGTCTSRLSIDENIPYITIYPNPSNGTFTIDVVENGIAVISNTIGSEVSILSLVKGKNNVLLSLAKGVYYIKINNNVTKLIIE